MLDSSGRWPGLILRSADGVLSCEGAEGEDYTGGGEHGEREDSETALVAAGEVAGPAHEGWSENSADYRSTYSAVVESCGQDTPAPQPLTPAPDRASCRDQAIGLVDIIEDGKMNTKAFVTARDKFAQTCPPLN